jgi:hypothetical protein
MENDMYTVVVESDGTVLARADFVNEYSAWRFWDSMRHRYGKSASLRFMAKPQAKKAA